MVSVQLFALSFAILAPVTSRVRLSHLSLSQWGLCTVNMMSIRSLHFSSDNSAGMTASSNDRVHYTSTEPTQSSSPALVAVASTLQTVGAAHEPTSLPPSPTTDKHELPVDAVVQPSTGVGAQGTPVHGSSLIPQSATSAFVPVTLTTPPSVDLRWSRFYFSSGASTSL